MRCLLTAFKTELDASSGEEQQQQTKKLTFFTI